MQKDCNDVQFLCKFGGTVASTVIQKKKMTNGLVHCSTGTGIPLLDEFINLSKGELGSAVCALLQPVWCLCLSLYSQVLGVLLKFRLLVISGVLQLCR